MTTNDDLDRRLGDWLEDGANTVPDWVVDDALSRAHATPQLGAGLRLPWIGRTLGLPALERVASLAVGAIAALAVVAAFALGLVTAPRIGDAPAVPSPVPTDSAGTPRPSAVLPRAVRGIEVVDVLPGGTDAVFALIGLAATRDAVWTVAVTEDPATGEPISRLIRIDAATRIAQPVELPRVAGALSPPVANGEVVWTASAGALHSVDAAGTAPTTVEVVGLQPREIAASGEGIWVAHSGGTSLVDPATGQILREIASHPGNRLGRITGAPIFGSHWECGPRSMIRVDPVSGEVTATIDLPVDEAERCRGAVAVSGIDAVTEAVLPVHGNTVIDPALSAAAAQIHVGGYWSDVIQVNGRLWFDVVIPAGRGLALVELDPTTRLPAQSLSVPGAGYSNTAFVSGTLAQTDDYVWVLADPTPDAPDGPQIVRIPKSEL